MKLTVYRQSSKTRADGTVAYKGEDARPYVDGQILMVADGLGGAAAIRHQSFRQELFDSEKLMDTLFQGVYDDYSDPRFVEYVTESFFELRCVKDSYTTNINNMKKSGYFASRIVTAVVLHEMLYNQACSPKAIFDGYAQAVEAGTDAQYLEQLGQQFKQCIQDNIRAIAKNANLIYESAYSGLALLGSTLCATIYFEREDCVEAIYLTAGDSRPYVWSAGDGLCQVLADEEGKDGGMTNYIKANDDADFHIRCSCFRFPKPCVLFNTSDGCFDSAAFVSQLAFEKVLLEAARDSEDMDAMAQRLTDYFVINGRHDDSSTIALKLFGYAQFEQLRSQARERLAVLEQEYLQKMPELLERDFVEAYKEAQRTSRPKLAGLKQTFEKESATRSYCAYLVERGPSPEYQQAMDKIGQLKAVQGEKLRSAQSTVTDIISKNYVAFVPCLGRKLGIAEGIQNRALHSTKAKRKQTAQNYVTTIQGYKREFDKAVSDLTGLLQSVFDIGVPDDFEDFDEISFRIVESCEKSMDTLFQFFESLRGKKNKLVKELARKREEYHRNNRKWAGKNPADVAALRKMLLSGKIKPQDFELFDDDRASLLAAMENYRAARAELDRLDSEGKETALQEAVDRYWETNYAEVIRQMVDEKAEHISGEALEQARTLLTQLAEQDRELKGKADTQQALFAKYDETYCKLMGGTKE